MTRVPDRIVVDAPISEVHRDRVEKEVFARLASARIVDRTDAAIGDVAHRSTRSRRLWVVGGALAAAAVVAIVAIRATRVEDPDGPLVVRSPTRIVTPVGGVSRFMVDDAVIDTASDTSIEVTPDARGGVTLGLARGTVDCDVAPRHGRAFQVRAGDVTVDVIGTRFAVARSPSGVRVDVARGKVHVHSSAGDSYVTAGETWSSAPVPIPPPPPALDAGVAAPAVAIDAAPDATVAGSDATPGSNAGGPNLGLAKHWIATGDAQLAAGSFDDAAIAYRRAIAADSRSHAALAGLAEVEFNEADFTHAALSAKQAVALAPSVVRYRMTLAKCYFKLMRYDDAVAQWQRVIELDPSNASAKQDISIAKSRMGQ